MSRPTAVVYLTNEDGDTFDVVVPQDIVETWSNVKDLFQPDVRVPLPFGYSNYMDFLLFLEKHQQSLGHHAEYIHEMPPLIMQSQYSAIVPDDAEQIERWLSWCIFLGCWDFLKYVARRAAAHVLHLLNDTYSNETITDPCPDHKDIYHPCAFPL